MRKIVNLVLGCTAFELTGAAQSAVPPERPSYLGLHLGQTQEEIKYLLGYPPNVVVSELSNGFPGYRVYDTASHDQINGMPANKQISDYSEWSYPRSGGRIDLNFSNARTLEKITCYSDTFQMCPPLYGISVGQSEASVVAALGGPTSSRLEGVAKFLNYDAFGLTLTLTQGRVYMISLRR